jgi:hypothetical protein
VGTGNEPDAFERTLGLETLADQPENGHFTVCPLDTLFALRSKVDVLDIVLN